MDMFFTYPLELFVARDTIEKAFFMHKPVSDYRRIAITCGLVLTTTLVGLTVCDLGSLFEMTGGMGSSIVAFILPSACWIKVNAMKNSTLGKTRYIHFFSIAFGVFIMLLTVGKFDLV
jgi:sodium-coupled neutral amino acid transporter 11